MFTTAEYFALQTYGIARNYDGIAHAQSEKPKSQIDHDVSILEQPLYVDGDDAGMYEGEAQIENAPSAKTSTLRRNLHLAHHFEEADLQKILSFDTADRTHAFVKELVEISFMQDGQLPVPVDAKQVQRRREHLHDQLVTPYHALSHVDEHLIEDLIQRQRSTFSSTSSTNEIRNDDENDPDAPPDPVHPRARLDDDAVPDARFAAY